jgi:hypothetical protein
VPDGRFDEDERLSIPGRPATPPPPFFRRAAVAAGNAARRDEVPDLSDRPKE